MDRIKVIDLIKFYVLGFLDAGNEANMKSFMEDTENFPWKELGQYQNLIALIPVNLKIEVPRAEVKDKVVGMLYELKEAVETSQQSTEVSFDEKVSISEEFQLDETKFDDSLSMIGEQGITIDEPIQEFTEELNTTENFSGFTEKTEISSGEKILLKEKQPDSKRSAEVSEKKSSQAEEHRRGNKMKDIIDREDSEKRTKEYINAYYQKKFEDLQEETKKALYIAIAGLSLAFIAAILAIIL